MIPMDRLLESVVAAVPGASTVDDHFQATHCDEVTPPHTRRMEQVASVLLTALLGPPLGIPWRLIGARPPCDPGQHCWRTREEIHPAIRSVVPKGAWACVACAHAYLATEEAPTPLARLSKSSRASCSPSSACSPSILNCFIFAL